MFTPEDYLKVVEEQTEVVKEARRKMGHAYEKAFACPVPQNLRPATPKDVVAGAVIWCPKFETDCKWCVVDEVLRPDDAFKAWSSDGCRYGLDGAFVEVKVSETERLASSD